MSRTGTSTSEEIGAAPLDQPTAGRSEISVAGALRIVRSRLSPEIRRALAPLVILMLAGALAELLTIGAVIPFLALVASTDASPALDVLAPIFDALGAETRREMLYVLTGLFALAAIAAAALRLTLLWATQNFVRRMSYELGILLYADTLHQPLLYHAARNSSEIIAAVGKVEMVSNSVLMPLMSAAVAFVIAAFITFGLIAIDPFAALFSGVGFVTIYFLASTLARRRLRSNAAIIAAAHANRVRAMQEGLGGIRDVLLDRSQPVFLERYERAERDYRDARALNGLLSGAPRFIVEGAGMVLIALVAVAVVDRPGGLAGAIPVLGALALGAQRLLPLVQQIYQGWAGVTGHRQDLVEIAALLSRPNPPRPGTSEALAFEQAIVLDDVGFTYLAARSPALRGIRLTIEKGARVGITGRTGSGKSTLMDLILALLEPTQGEIRIDGVPLSGARRAAWQCNVAHVPQTIFLADTSIAENIAFGVRPQEIDLERVHIAAAQAELAEVVAMLPDGYDTRVGERGIQLSGGQCQRIGIARALYKQASVLVFDEATSALDISTESAVMSAVERLDRSLTIIVIAHRLSTLAGCDFVLRLENGEVEAVEKPLAREAAGLRRRA